MTVFGDLDLKGRWWLYPSERLAPKSALRLQLGPWPSSLAASSGNDACEVWLQRDTGSVERANCRDEGIICRTSKDKCCVLQDATLSRGERREVGGET
jgi:hypothetical protein